MKLKLFLLLVIASFNPIIYTTNLTLFMRQYDFLIDLDLKDKICFTRLNTKNVLFLTFQFSERKADKFALKLGL